MDTNTLIALTVLIDHFQKEETLIHETLELLQKIPKILDPDAVPADIDPPCRMAPAEPEKEYTYEQVRKIFTEKSSHGLRAEMKTILASHSLQKLSDAKEDQHLLNRLAAEAEAVQNA